MLESFGNNFLVFLLIIGVGLLILTAGVISYSVPVEAMVLVMAIGIAVVLLSQYTLWKHYEILLPSHLIMRSVSHIFGGIFVLLLGELYGLYAVRTFAFACLVSYCIYEYFRWIKRIKVFLLTETLKFLGSFEELEKKPFLSPVYAFLGILSVLALLTPSVKYVSRAYASITVLALGDGAAAVSGRTIGKNPIPICRQKTLEGSIVGFVVSFVGCLFWVPPEIAFIGSLVCIISEALPMPINDNFTVFCDGNGADAKFNGALKTRCGQLM